MKCCECQKDLTKEIETTLLSNTCLGCYRMGNSLLGESYKVGSGNLRRFIIDWYAFDYITNESIGRF